MVFGLRGYRTPGTRASPAPADTFAMRNRVSLRQCVTKQEFRHEDTHTLARLRTLRRRCRREVAQLGWARRFALFAGAVAWVGDAAMHHAVQRVLKALGDDPEL